MVVAANFASIRLNAADNMVVARDDLAAGTPVEDVIITTAVLGGHKVATAEMGERIFKLMLDTASGQPSKSESHGIGDQEFCPWQSGAVM